MNISQRINVSDGLKLCSIYRMVELLTDSPLQKQESQLINDIFFLCCFQNATGIGNGPIASCRVLHPSQYRMFLCGARMVTSVAKYRKANKSFDDSIKTLLLLAFQLKWVGLDRCLQLSLRVGQITNKRVINCQAMAAYPFTN